MGLAPPALARAFATARIRPRADRRFARHRRRRHGILLAAGRCSTLDHAAFGYLIPVIIAATRWGITAGRRLGAGRPGSVGILLLPAALRFHVANRAHVADLVLFAVVAVVTGQLASRVREHVREAQQREAEVKALDFFSRRLAWHRPRRHPCRHRGPPERDHGCRIALLPPARATRGPTHRRRWREVPEEVQRAILTIFEGRSAGQEAPLTDRATGASWLIRILSQRNSVVGILAIELGPVSRHGVDAIRQRVDAALEEAAATMERSTSHTPSARPGCAPRPRHCGRR